VAINIINGGDFNFTSASTTTSKLALNATASGTANAYGFYLNNGLGYMPFITTNISVSGAASVYGLYADNSTFIGAYGTSVKDFAIGSKSGDTITYGLSTTATGSDKAAGIYATNNSEVLVPKYTAYVQGNGIVSKSGSKVAVGGDKASSATTIYVDNANTNNYAALLAEGNGSQIDINLKDTFLKGVITFGAVPHTNEVNINGNVVATNSGTVNLAMTKNTSTWEGVAYNNGGTVNLWLQNGAIWTNDKWGDQTGFNGSHITNLTGGAIGTDGVIMMKDTNALTIDKLDGMVKVFYAHTNDGDEAGDYAGDIKITSANASTTITLITDKTGIDMANNTAVEAALMALSGKLYYLGYTTGEDNLAGYVQIAEGLTASSAMLKAGNIAFDNSTGKGSYEPDVYKTAQTKFALGNMITGVENNDKAYKKAGILREDGKYHLDDDTVITNNGTGSDYSTVINNGPITIEGEGKKLTLNVTGDATRIQAISQVGISNPITINVDTLKIDVSDSARTEGILATNTESQAVKPVLTVNGNVDLKLRAGGTAAFGLHVYSYAGINITGDVAIKGDGTGDDKWGINAYGTNGKTIGNSYFGNAAIHVQSQMQNNYSGSIVIGGDVDVLAQAAGLYINGGSGVIEIKGGGKIEIDPTVYASAAFGDAVYGAMRSELGYIYMNVVKDSADGVKGNVTGAGTKQVNILGNVIVSRGADNASLAPDHLNSIINLGLSTADSTWKGVAYNAYSNAADDVFRGEINLWLQNGATWTNELYGVTGNPYAGLKFSGNEGDKAVYDGSRINKLVGGSSADNSGIIFQNDTNPLTIDNYSGYTKIFYAHTNDGDEATDYAAGDITIKAAATGSTITLITDNSNIDTSNKVLTDKVLNALAGKLFYTAYTTGEDNLSGVVQIAEGLTSASATLVTSEMMFKVATGQGMLKVVSLGTQITNDKTTNQEYVDLNILRDDDKYYFDKDFVVDVKDLTGGANLAAAAYGANPLDLELADNTTLTLSASGSGKLFTVDAKNGLLVNGGTNSKLVLDLLSSKNAYGGINMTAADNTKVATINTDVDISVKSSGTGFSGYALGIYASKGTMNINGKLTMKNGENPGVTNISGTEPDYFGWIDVYSTNGAVVNLKTVDIISGGEGLYANNGGSVINVDGGSIVHLKNNSKYYALRAAGATINVNMNGDKTAPANNDVVIKGNITTQSDWVNKSSDNTKDTVINLGLTTANSSLNGVAYNVFGNDGITNSGKTFKGYINMWLQNGATWTNENWSAGEAMKGTYGGEDFAGSHLAKLVGGSSAANSGIIFQKDGNPLTIDSYSGNTKFIFSHNNSGTAITDYSAGDIIIKNAASGSNISLITDNQGINTSNTTVVDNVLGALARKLYYTAYVDGERNLTGSVGIAEGLTGSSATLVSDSFDYIAETGQGVYKDIVPPAEPVDPTPAVVSSDVLTATMNDKAFLNDKITSSNNVVNYNLTDKAYSYHSLNAAPDSKAVIDVGGGNALYFDGKTNKNLGIVLNDGANVTINGNVDVSSYSESYDAAGIAMIIGGSGIGKKTDLTINGKVTMGSADAPGVIAEDKHGAYSTYNGTRWTGAAINMNMGHGSTINITDGLTAYVDGHGIVTDPYYADKNYKDEQLAVVNVNGPTNITVKSNEDVGLYALANFGGTINVNMQNGQPGTDKVNIYGNTMVMKDTMGAEDNPYFYRSGEINLALTTADSMWSGVADNTGASQAGKFNLYLKNGGTWNYEDASKTNGLSASSMPSPSLSYYGNYDGVSHITSLTGGENNSDAGKINMVSDDKIIVGSYSGNINVDYSNSGSSMSGGIMSIASADVASVITLTASNTDVTPENYQQVLNALAGQLYYTAGNENLIGKLKIDGTSYSGYIAFDGSGKGYFTTESNKTLAETPLGGLNDDNFENVVVSGSDTARTYTMTNGIKVEVETGSAIVTKNANAANADVIVKNGNNLLVLVADQKTSPVIDAS
ncbi:MAG: hypothetical protein KBS60_03895, partial [Phascolarctobacterium sp.]|nr:hypothetical protein [Candidatus Phascolarctobacterium caballi]